MNTIGLNIEGLEEFYSTNGLEKLIDYELNEKSVILELGGYDGTWITKIINMYNPHVYVIEPIKEFHDNIKSIFSANPKFSIANVGISDVSKEGEMYINGDSTSAYSENGEIRIVTFKTMSDILTSFNIESVDLLQINIEGEEYKLLENMISTGIINKFKNLQIQFHTGISDYKERRLEIHKNLIKNGFISAYEYPFIWEGWKKITNKS